MSGFPSSKEFKGVRVDTFEVVEKIDTSFNGETLNDCWRIEIKSNHSLQGNTEAEYIFSESCGFLKMNYLFYDGVRINYILKDIIIDEKLKN